MEIVMNLKEIDKRIESIRGLVSNVNTSVQETAVAIIEHAAGAGRGDVSRAIKLVRVLGNANRQEFLIRWFEHFGSIGINLKDDKCKRIDSGSKRYRADVPMGFDLDGARMNNWYEPFGANGEGEATWYKGPNPKAFTPNTLLDFGQNIHSLADRMFKQLDQKKTVNGEEVPMYAMSPEEKTIAKKALNLVRLVASGMEDQGRMAEIEADLKRIQTDAGEKLKPIEPMSADVDPTVTPDEVPAAAAA
jgi:hypothetical protein